MQSFTVLLWPGNSPDLDPVENYWCELGEKRAKMKTQTKRPLQELLIKVLCHHLMEAYVQYLIRRKLCVVEIM